MEIEIITTKKKLTKSIIKQIPGLPDSLFEEVKILGYLRVDCFRNMTRFALCKGVKDYYLLNMHWEKRGHYAGYNLPGRAGERQKRFTSVNIDVWMEKYNKLKTAAEEKGHIYI